MRTITILVSSLFFYVSTLFSQNDYKSDNDFPILKGPYLGQKKIEKNAEIFAPNIISDGMCNRDVAVSPEGTEMYFGLHTPDFKYSTIIVTKLINGIWSPPEVVSFARDPEYMYLEPAFGPDGKKLYFLSNMPKDSSKAPLDEDIWFVERNKEGWGKPCNLGKPINSDGKEFFPSLTKTGTLYFTRSEKDERICFIYKSEYVNGEYAEPERLPKQVNCGTNRFNAYVDRDEKFIVVSALGVENNTPGVDYYIIFKNTDNSWNDPINMGSKINSSEGNEWSFYISPDSKFIFFMASKGLSKEMKPKELSIDFFKNISCSFQNGNSDIYWISTDILKDLKQKLK